MTWDRSLPIDAALTDIRHALRTGDPLVVTAPPGAGKTTVVPLALLDQPWLGGRRIIMLEPRRLAARAAAFRMAFLLGEQVGETVGYRMRLDTKVGSATRIEVVTEGVLSRVLQHDPALEAYGVVIFDEFHERSLQTDLGLALTLESRAAVRPDLRVVVMSATLDTERVAGLLGASARTVNCPGRLYPIETRYLERPPAGLLDQAVAQVVRQAWREEKGSMLVFLPGMAEIRHVQRRLREPPLGEDTTVAILHGDLPQPEQDAAIAPAPPGRRKIVLSTSIAETSLTIEGIRIVVDAGLMRVPSYHPGTALTRLETVRVTRDAAEQRRGRAGRLESGVCYRLWTAPEDATLLSRRRPEIVCADLTALVLELCAWGAHDPSRLSWLDPPPPAAVGQAREVLRRLGALDATGRMTDHGRLMIGFGLHPRLAHMILKAGTLGAEDLACDVAALLGERDVLRGPPPWRNADLRVRLDALRHRMEPDAGVTVDRGVARRIQAAAALYRRTVKAAHVGTPTLNALDEHEQVGILLLFSYPDRLAQRLPGSERRYRLANGRGAVFPHPDPLTEGPYLVIAELTGAAEWSEVRLAAPVTIEQIEQHAAELIQERETVQWDEQAQAVVARRRRSLDAIVLSETAVSEPDSDMVREAMLAAIRRMGISALPWTADLRQWQARVLLLRRTAPEAGWPDVGDERLLDTLESWLGPILHGMTRLHDLRRIGLSDPLHALLSWEQRRDLDLQAPTHLTVPTGSRIRLDYIGHDYPVLAVRLQEMFGARDTPRVAYGHVPVTISLLSPAGRPVQVTQDLAGFWRSSYHDVRKELRGRYPKHHWPENPLTATPTRRTKPRER